MVQNLSQGCSVFVDWGCSHYKALQGVGSTFQLTPMAVDRPRVLSDCWLETSVSCHVGFSVEQLRTQQLTSLRRWKPQSFCNLILEMTPHHFCCILFVRSESLCPVYTEGERITQKNHWESSSRKPTTASPRDVMSIRGLSLVCQF